MVKPTPEFIADPQQLRVSWLDLCRGIAIILVMYGHTLIANTGLQPFIYAFHMPLFFFLSGIVFHYKQRASTWLFLKKNVRSILIPYFFYGIVTFLVTVLLSFKWWLLPELPDVIGQLIYGSGMGNNLWFNTALWFLPCLFATKSLFFLFTKITNKAKLLLVFLILSSVVGYAISLFYPDASWPFEINVAFTAVVFFGVGYLWNGMGEGLFNWIKKHAVMLFIVGTIICAIAGFANFQLYGDKIDMRANQLDNYYLFYLGAFSGMLATVALSIKIHKNKILEYIGRKSLILFVWHWIVIVQFYKILRLFYDQDFINQLNWILAPLLTVICLVVILGIDYIFQRGKQKIHLLISASK